MKKYLILATLFCLLFTSCSQDVDIIIPPMYYYAIPTYIYPGTTNNQGQSAIAFSNYGNGQTTRAVATTRASASSTSATGYDDFKFYGWTKDSVVINGYNVSYVYPGWTYVGINDQQLHWFDNFVNKYEFIGIIPQDIQQTFNNGVVNVTGVESFLINNPYEGIQNVGNDTPKEFLYSYSLVESSEYSEGVNMNFVHGNSKIYLKFTSDDPNTEIIDYYPVTPEQPAIPEVIDTVGVYVNLKNTSNVIASVTNLSSTSPIPDNLLAEIKSYYSVNGSAPGDYSLKPAWSGNIPLKIVKPIPDAYKKSVYMYTTGIIMDFFDGFKYLQDNGCDIQPGSNGGKPAVWDYILLDGYANDNGTYGIKALNWGHNNSVPQYEVNITPGSAAVPGTGIPGIVVLPAKITTTPNRTLSTYVVKADATINSSGCEFTPTDFSSNINLTKPEGKISTTAVSSPTVLFALPCNDSEIGFTVKFSFTYKGTNIYDARVWIPANHVQWQQGKYYTYTINIKGRGNGKPEPSNPEGDDPTIPDSQSNYQITVTVSITDYTAGENHEYDI